jgi:hypothetical protein
MICTHKIGIGFWWVPTEIIGTRGIAGQKRKRAASLSNLLWYSHTRACPYSTERLSGSAPSPSGLLVCCTTGRPLCSSPDGSPGALHAAFPTGEAEESFDDQREEPLNQLLGEAARFPANAL